MARRGMLVSLRGLCGIIAFALAAAAQATPLATWNFEFTSGGTTRTPGSTDANVVVGDLTLGPGIDPVAEANSFGGDGFRDSISDPPSYDQAVADGEYVTFTIKAATGYTLSLAGFDPYNVKHNTLGPTQGDWEYALDGTTFQSITGVNFGVVTGDSGNDMDAIDLSGIGALQNLPDTTTVTFRLVIHNASGTNGDWFFNGHHSGGPLNDPIKTFVVNGTVVPEPAAIGLLAAAVLAWSRRRR